MTAEDAIAEPKRHCRPVFECNLKMAFLLCATNIPALLCRVRAVIDQLEVEFEILIVDDDPTAARGSSSGACFIDSRNFILPRGSSKANIKVTLEYGRLPVRLYRGRLGLSRSVLVSKLD